MVNALFSIITASYSWNYPSRINSRIHRSLDMIRSQRGKETGYIVHTNELKKFNTTYAIIAFTVIGMLFMLSVVMLPYLEHEDVDTRFVDIMAVPSFVIVFIIPMWLMIAMLISHSKIVIVDRRGLEVWVAKKETTYSLGSVKWSDVLSIEIRATNSMTGGDHLMWMYTTDGNIRVWMRWVNIRPLLEYLRRHAADALEASDARTNDAFDYYLQATASSDREPGSRANDVR